MKKEVAKYDILSVPRGADAHFRGNDLVLAKTFEQLVPPEEALSKDIREKDIWTSAGR